MPDVDTKSANGMHPAAGPSGKDFARWFTTGDTERLYLDDDKTVWVEVKHSLTWRERQQLSGAMLRTIKGERGESEVGIDMARFSQMKLRLYLVDWNLPGPGGKTMPFNEKSIDSLNEQAGAAIEAAIDAFLSPDPGAQAAEGKAQKQGTQTEPPTTAG